MDLAIGMGAPVSFASGASRWLAGTGLTSQPQSESGADSGASTAAAETKLLEMLRQAEAFVAKLQRGAAKQSGTTGDGVVVTLSALARQLGDSSSQTDAAQSSDLLAQWRNALTDRQKADLGALGQLQELSKQMRRARHGEASARLQQLLAQYRALRMAGVSAKALADLARQIKAAANELAASGESGGAGLADPVGAEAAPTSADAGGATAADASKSGGAAPPGQIAADAAVPATASGDAAQPSTSRARGMWQQLVQQATEEGARAQERAEDELLLQQARAVIGQIERMIKQAEEEKRHAAQRGVTMVGRGDAPSAHAGAATAGASAGSTPVHALAHVNTVA